MKDIQKRKAAYLTSEERRAAIVEAAYKVIQEHGYAKLTARRIAEHPGVSLGHITYNFRDMNEILVEAYRYSSRSLVAIAAGELDSAPDDPYEKLEHFIRAFFKPAVLNDKTLRVRIDLWSAALNSDEIRQTEVALYDHYREFLGGLLTSLATNRGQPADRVQFLVDSITAFSDGVWLEWLRRRDKQALENAIQGCLLLVNTVLPVSAARP